MTPSPECPRPRSVPHRRCATHRLRELNFETAATAHKVPGQRRSQLRDHGRTSAAATGIGSAVGRPAASWSSAGRRRDRRTITWQWSRPSLPSRGWAGCSGHPGTRLMSPRRRVVRAFFTVGVAFDNREFRAAATRWTGTAVTILFCRISETAHRGYRSRSSPTQVRVTTPRQGSTGTVNARRR